MPISEFTFTRRCRPIVEIGTGNSQVSTGQARWDRARWDRSPEATWGGDEPTWNDVTCDVVSARIEWGRDRITDAFPSDLGTTVVVDNATGWADPNAVEDPAILTLRPGRAIRIGVDHVEFGVVWLWRGFIDEMLPVYYPTEPDQVALKCIDAFGEVGRAKLAGTTAEGTSETASQRFHRLLNRTPWLQTKRDVEEATTPLVAAVADGQLADLLRQTADSHGGHAFGDVDGNVVLKNRDWMFFRESDPVDGTIGNRVADAVCPTEWVRPFTRRDIATRVLLDREMPPETTTLPEPRVHQDDRGMQRYGVEPFEIRDLWTRDDADIDRIGRRVLATRSAATMPRIQAVTVEAPTGDQTHTDRAVDLLARLSIHKPSRYRCRLELDRGVVFDEEDFAVGVIHEMTRDRWHAEIALDRADLFELEDDDARWDRSGWDRARWT